MTLSAVTTEPTPAGSSNVRLVVVDDNQQPRYLLRAAQLEESMLALLQARGVEPDDVPGLHGLCVAAIRSAEQHGR